MSRLALGTAQFGLVYGVSNTRGQTGLTEVGRILAAAREANLDTLDTAIAYGESESSLGAVGVAGWRVVTKLPALPPDTQDVGNWVFFQVKGSLARLQQNRLYGLLLHRPKDLLGPRGKRLADALKNLQSEGFVGKIGVSVYDPEELEDVMPVFTPDLIQMPFNPFDQRLLRKDILAYLRENKIEVHVRSIFLQGLLLMSSEVRPDYFKRWQVLWNRWDAWLADHNLSPLTACVSFALSQKQIHRVVVGVENFVQLQQILRASNANLPPVPPELQCSDPDLINPSRWKLE